LHHPEVAAMEQADRDKAFENAANGSKG
jgi:hypothetical protein